MFTGIIREIGVITRIKRGNPWIVTIEAPDISGSVSRGDSIAVSGACLTAVAMTDKSFDVDVSRETLSKTTLESWKSGTRVNLEPAITMSAALDGHIVQGHIDGTGKIVRVSGSRQREIWVRPDKDPGALIVSKGSVSIDGISLTIADFRPGGEFSVAVIPLTLSDTTLQYRRAGDRVNLEYDIIGKYVHRWMTVRQ